MKNLLPILVLCLASIFTHAQNILSNGDFEFYTRCPSNQGEVDSCVGWKQLQFNSGTPDFFNTCALSTSGVSIPVNIPGGYQYAASGNGCAGFFVHGAGREHIERALPQLMKNKHYEVSLSLVTSNVMPCATDDIGVYFYVNRPALPSGTVALPVIPQAVFPLVLDTLNWTRVTDTIQADSNYQGMIIGSFKDNSSHNVSCLGSSRDGYMLIDSVVIRRLTGIFNKYTDSMICAGDTFNVSYDALGGAYLSGNTFTVQLSDATGSFSSGTTNIGSLNSQSGGSIRCVVPPTVTPGSNYRLRILSSNVVDSSEANLYNIHIGNTKPSVIVDTLKYGCVGQSLTLANITPSANVAYSWSGPNGFTSLNTNPTINPVANNSSGNYIVTARLYGCLNKDTTFVEVIRTDSLLAVDNIFCETDTLKLRSYVPGHPLNLSWNGPGSFTSAARDTFIANSLPVMSGNYILRADYGICIATDTAQVQIKPRPATFITGTNSPICANSTLTLSANSTSSGVTYSWTGPNTFSSTLQAPAITNAQPIASGDYYITATLNGCSIKDTVPVIVTALPPRPVTTANSPVCIGQSLNLTATSTPGVTYIWNGPAGFSTLTQNPTISNAGSSHAGSYTVRAIDNGCTSVEDTIHVAVITAPNVGIYPSPSDTICQGARLTLVGTPTNGGSAPQYQWYKNNIAIPSATTTSYVTNTAADKDIFYCTMTTTGVCADPYTDTSNRIPITVLPWLTPSVSIAATPNTPVNGGEMITFNATPVNGGTKPVYQWTRNNADVIGAISNTWGSPSLANADTICVVMTSNYRCPSPATAKSNCIVVQINTTSIDNATLLNGIKIYPNPTSNNITIEGIQTATTIQLFDVTGRQVINTTAQQSTATINTHTLAAGTYILQLTLPNGEKLNSKITKQ